MSSTTQFSTKDLSLTALVTAILCILAPFTIPLPFSPVPISLTNLILYLSGYIIGWKKSTLSYLLYLFIGFIGIPVFSNFSGGLGKLVGPTGGYLIGFIFLVFISSYIIEKFPNKNIIHFLGFLFGTFVTYVLGTSWLALQTGTSFIQALALGVLPFIIGDIVKMILACIIGVLIQKTLKSAAL